MSQTLQQAIVKSVQSGDSIIIRSQPKGGPPPEKQINLAYLMAPKISRKLPDGTYTADEPFAWESREFLRKKLVGKVIQFRIEYKVPFGGNQRECATVFLAGENINETLVNEGLVDVVKRSQNKDNPDVIKLIELEVAKSQSCKGKWNNSAPAIKRNIVQDFENAQSFVGKYLDGIVEHVRDGSTLKIGLFLPSNDKSTIIYQMAMIVLSGVRCPQTNEPFGEEARFFTESRLLQRDVKVHIEQINPNGNTVVASVTFMDRDIVEYLLREGYAKCIDRTLGLTKDPKKLRQLEAEAKSKKIRLWKDFKETARTATSNVMNFDAKVLEIASADSIVIQHNDTKEIKKIFLASIRAPRLVNEEGQTIITSGENKKQFRPLYDIPFMFEAREFLRKKLIGKTVKIRIDYVQPKTENFPEKVCCTVTTGDGQNIAEQLVLNGLATVVKYRQDDDQRALDYDSYLAAEQKAQKANKGLHSNKADAGMVRIADLSVDLTKAKSMAPFLTRSTGIRREAVVEYVFPSSTKLKVYIPKESCLINLVLSGVNTPKPNDAMLNEAVQHVRLRVLQRDVHIEIESVDKIGNYIGSVYYDKTHSLALDLVRNGLLSVREYNKNMELNNAEQEAKTARRGIWKDYKEEVMADNIDEIDLDGDNDTANAAAAVDDIALRKRVIITNLAKDFTSFHAQQVKDGPEIETMLQRLRQEALSNPPIAGSYKPKKGDLVMAKFSEDGLWYRARVEKTINANETQVIYIDYGNRETLDNKNIATLPLGNFASIPAAAKEYSFAFVFPDTDDEFNDEARAVFMDMTANKTLLLKAEYKDANGLEAATLLDETDKKDIILQMVKDGWLFVDTKTRRDRRLLKKINEYKEAQEYAKKNGLNLWQYGDVTPDDAKEFGYPTH
uniref:Staphylococcal nuclease domain-containing protein 1 n=1 Tax=Psoroptes ovis TaxID=83912 RepID=A0A3B0RFF3_PSOOV|nr:staphylococcal nuclease domain-containing protein 1-like [Psoroptes ovis]